MQSDGQLSAFQESLVTWVMSIFATALQAGIIFLTNEQPHQAWVAFAATTFAAVALLDVTVTWTRDRDSLGVGLVLLIVLCLFLGVTYLGAEQTRVDFDPALVRGPNNTISWLAGLAGACMALDLIVRARESYGRLPR